MVTRNLTASIEVPANLEEVFAFFAAAENLQRLTPPWLDFRILTPMPVAMEAGLRLDYRIGVRGMKMRWQSEISLWEPPHRFVDEQVRGPYRYWHHLHEFIPIAGGTRIVDTVTYRVPGGLLEGVLHGLLVHRDLRRIFAYRTERIVECFGACDTPPILEFGTVQSNRNSA